MSCQHGHHGQVTTEQCRGVRTSTTGLAEYHHPCLDNSRLHRGLSVAARPQSSLCVMRDVMGRGDGDIAWRQGYHGQVTTEQCRGVRTSTTGLAEYDHPCHESSHLRH